ncbi:general transcription factor IIH subunit 1, partial [Eurytemora carolleeae]|uniref:general transcription factor IIH subunit 1 n=1 Tax=Eurytemora carolleeae TaxID=1294199 RepID=UPI000C7640C7
YDYDYDYEGIEAQLADRERVKEKLVELLPKFKRKINKELEEKNKTLSDNPGLLQLYKDLVITQIISAEEFWSSHASQYIKQKQGVFQEVGVSGSFLSEIKPQADGANGLRYNLTPDIIESIFKTYPAVKKKHFENVPSKLSEQEFWTKFFQSHYFHRDRIHAQGTTDIFTECAKEDDKFMKKQMKKGVDETLADIQGGTSQNIIHQNIIKRFNHHSIMVMEAAENKEAVEEAQPQPPKASRKRLNEKTAYEDLDAPQPKKESNLSLSRMERYFTGPTPAASQDYLTQDELKRSRTNLAAELETWASFGQRHQSVLTSSNAVHVLGELCPGGSMMTGRTDKLAEQCPVSVQADLRQLYSSLCELIRHFWSSFPPTTPELQEKAKKMYDTLQKFQSMKVRPFEKEVERRYSAGGGLITQHINSMLEAAYRKYTTWYSRKQKS